MALTDAFDKINSINDLSDFIQVRLKDLTFLLYSKEEKYTSFEITQKNGKKRMIHAPIGILKNVQLHIKKILEEFYKPLANVYGFCKGKNIKKMLRFMSILQWF